MSAFISKKSLKRLKVYWVEEFCVYRPVEKNLKEETET